MDPRMCWRGRQAHAMLVGGAPGSLRLGTSQHRDRGCLPPATNAPHPGIPRRPGALLRAMPDRALEVYRRDASPVVGTNMSNTGSTPCRNRHRRPRSALSRRWGRMGSLPPPPPSRLPSQRWPKLTLRRDRSTGTVRGVPTGVKFPSLSGRRPLKRYPRSMGPFSSSAKKHAVSSRPVSTTWRVGEGRYQDEAAARRIRATSLDIHTELRICDGPKGRPPSSW